MIPVPHVQSNWVIFYCFCLFFFFLHFKLAEVSGLCEGTHAKFESSAASLYKFLDSFFNTTNKRGVATGRHPTIVQSGDCSLWWLFSPCVLPWQVSVLYIQEQRGVNVYHTQVDTFCLHYVAIVQSTCMAMQHFSSIFNAIPYRDGANPAGTVTPMVGPYVPNQSFRCWQPTPCGWSLCAQAILQVLTTNPLWLVRMCPNSPSGADCWHPAPAVGPC